MQYQSRQFNCGPAAMHNALNWLYGSAGPSITECEDAIRKDGVLDTNGTTERDLKKIAKIFGAKSEGFSTKNFFDFASYLEWWRAPFVLHDRLNQHWVVCLGKQSHLNGSYIIVDSAQEDLILNWPTAVLKAHCYERGKRMYALRISR